MSPGAAKRGLTASRQFLTRVVRRFFDIEGIDQSGLLAIELFTTVLPLTILGFSWFKDFSSSISVGDIYVHQLRLSGSDADQVRAAFGSMSGTHTWWTFFGLAGFLVWGVPMALTVSRMFSLAWARPELPWVARLWRGGVWFVVYLPMMFLSARFAMASGQDSPIGVALPFLLSLIPPLLFWAVTPVLLLPGVPHTRADLLRYGLVGMAVNAVVLRLAGRVVFPQLLHGWDGFGPIGVTLTLVIWMMFQGGGWVLTACVTGVMAEQRAGAADAAPDAAESEDGDGRSATGDGAATADTDPDTRTGPRTVPDSRSVPGTRSVPDTRSAPGTRPAPDTPQ